MLCILQFAFLFFTCFTRFLKPSTCWITLKISKSLLHKLSTSCEQKKVEFLHRNFSLLSPNSKLEIAETLAAKRVFDVRNRQCFRNVKNFARLFKTMNQILKKFIQNLLQRKSKQLQLVISSFTKNKVDCL